LREATLRLNIDAEPSCLVPTIISPLRAQSHGMDVPHPVAEVFGWWGVVISISLLQEFFKFPSSRTKTFPRPLSRNLQFPQIFSPQPTRLILTSASKFPPSSPLFCQCFVRPDRPFSKCCGLSPSRNSFAADGFILYA